MCIAVMTKNLNVSTRIIIFIKQNMLSFISLKKTPLHEQLMSQSQFEGHFKLHTNSAFKSAERLFT